MKIKIKKLVKKMATHLFVVAILLLLSIDSLKAFTVNRPSVVSVHNPLHKIRIFSTPESVEGSGAAAAPQAPATKGFGKKELKEKDTTEKYNDPGNLKISPPPPFFVPIRVP